MPDARLPPEPGAPHELAEDPRIDVAAAVAAQVDHEAVAVEDRIVVALPGGDVGRSHRAQVHVADATGAQRVDTQAARVLPLGVAQVGFAGGGNGRHDDAAWLAAGAADTQPHLASGLAA